MDEQKTLTLDFVKSLMEPAYTLVWTDYNDNLDDHRGLIQKLSLIHISEPTRP